MNQILLYHAEKDLTISEKNFEKELENYKNQLLLEAYYQKLSSEKEFSIEEPEAKLFLKQYAQNQNEKRALVRINYVKLSKNSKIAKQIKEILFDETKRVDEKKLIEQLCADSVEYFIDDSIWLYLDYIESEFSFKIDDRDDLMRNNKYINIADDNYEYFVVFLDYKTHYLSTNVEEELEIAKTLLRQEKMTDYLSHIKDSLYQDAIDNKIIIR